MLNTNKKAFTLVELIVVITILAILGTIGFISLQGYSSEARDSKRITDLGQIRTGIQVYQAKEGVVPEPSETKTIIGSGTTNLIIQGYAGTGVLNNIRVNDDAKDPLENNYYTYSTNGAKTKFQLLALLENQETVYNIVSTTYANYETRDLYSVGDKLGILLDSTTNTPVQELGETSIDLSTNSIEYKAVFSKSDIQTLSGTSLHQEIVTKSNNTGVEEKSEPEPIVYSSCKEILDNGVSIGDGTYIIDPENNGVGFEVYCDMTTDGGGWTKLWEDKTTSKNLTRIDNCSLNGYYFETNFYCITPTFIGNIIEYKGVNLSSVKKWSVPPGWRSSSTYRGWSYTDGNGSNWTFREYSQSGYSYNCGRWGTTHCSSQENQILWGR